MAFPSNNDVPLDQEGRDLGDELAGMRHQRDAARRSECRIQRLGVVEPQLDDAVDRKLLVAHGISFWNFSPDDEVLSIATYASYPLDESSVLNPPLVDELLVRDIGATAQERHALDHRPIG